MPNLGGYGESLTRNDIGLLILRLAVGVVVCLNGLQKFFGFGEDSVPFVQQFTPSGWTNGDLVATVLAAGESVGGALLITGLLTPLGACAVMATMIDTWLETQSMRPNIQLGGTTEYSLVLAASATSLALLGPGQFSVDARFGRTQWPAAMSYALLLLGIGAPIAAWVLLKGNNPFG